MKRICKMTKEEKSNLGCFYHQKAILIESVKDFQDAIEVLKHTIYSYQNCNWESDTLSVDLEGEINIKNKTYLKISNNLWPAGWSNHYYTFYIDTELFYNTDDFKYLTLNANYPFKSGIISIENYYK